MRLTFLLEVRTPYRDDFLARLCRTGAYDVDVLYASETEYWRDWNLSEASYCSRSLPGVSLGGRRGGFALKLNRRVVWSLENSGPDVLIVGGYALPAALRAMIWASRRSVPYVILSESNALMPLTLRRAVALPVVRAAVKRASAFLVTSSPAQAYLERRGASSDKVFLLPNAPDVRRIAEEAEAARSDARQRARRVLFVGRLIEAKGLSILMEAWHRVQNAIPEAELVIAGSGPMRAELEQRGRDAGYRIAVLGFCQPKELVDLYTTAQVFVLPSTFEPYGVVLLEAMACSVPVVVSDAVGAAADLVTESSGILFPSGDAMRLADALVALLQDTGRRERMAVEACRSALRWDMEYCLATFDRAIAAAVAKNDNP